MTVNYDLQVTTDGYFGSELQAIISSVSEVIGVYPGYTYQSTRIDGNMIHIYYSDDTANPQAELAPVIVYAILGVFAILGIAVITSKLVVLTEKAPAMVYTGLIVAGLFAIGYLITATRKGGN